mmetsp:Transcript_74032/g.197372  ORF Transcript_74032/g.197372 Transcript_74032/m.197372 type:complete len:207 (-) Transcript_74032:918-1538(-)
MCSSVEFPSLLCSSSRWPSSFSWSSAARLFSCAALLSSRSVRVAWRAWRLSAACLDCWSRTEMLLSRRRTVASTDSLSSAWAFTHPWMSRINSSRHASTRSSIAPSPRTWRSPLDTSSARSCASTRFPSRASLSCRAVTAEICSSSACNERFTPSIPPLLVSMRFPACVKSAATFAVSSAPAATAEDRADTDCCSSSCRLQLVSSS